MQSRRDSPATAAPFSGSGFRPVLSCPGKRQDRLLHKRLLDSSCGFCPRGSVCHESPLYGPLRTRGETHREKTPGRPLVSAKRVIFSLPASIVAFSWRAERSPTTQPAWLGLCRDAQMFCAFSHQARVQVGLWVCFFF